MAKDKKEKKESNKKPSKPVTAKKPAATAAKKPQSKTTSKPKPAESKATEKVSPVSVDHIDEKTMKKIIEKLHEMREESLEVVNTQLKADLIRKGETADVGDDMDQASNERDREFSLLIHQRHLRRLQQIEEAFERIHDGSYGLCEGTDEPINPKRLLIMPLAKFSIEYQQQQEKMLGRNPEEAHRSYDDSFISDE